MNSNKKYHFIIEDHGWTSFLPVLFTDGKKIELAGEMLTRMDYAYEAIAEYKKEHNLDENDCDILVQHFIEV